jgi:hypothetical protein
MSLDPGLTLRRLLAQAYMDAVVLYKPRAEVARALAAAIKAEDITSIIPSYLANLEAVVKASSLGERCGDFISQTQLALLKESLNR